MKKLLTLLSFIIASTAIQSQNRSCDLDVTLMSPIEYDFVQTLKPMDVIVKVRNNGPNAITVKDTIFYTLLYDGDSVMSAGKPLQKGFYGYALQPNQEVTQQLYGGLSQYYNTGGVHIYCVSVKLQNRSASLGSSDPNSANNSGCHHVYVTIYTFGIDDKNEAGKGKTITIAPNPANTNTVISYAVDKSAEVKLNIIDMQGREVMQVINATLSAGVYEKSIDLSALDAGIYFVQYAVGGNVFTSKMVKQ